MSLNFDLTACKTRLGEERYEEITTSPWDSKKWHPVTDSLIWNCMFTGLGEITEKNVDEFAARLAILRMKHGPELRYGDGSSVALTHKDVENHIGLRTNAFPVKTRAKWLAEVFSTSNDEKKDGGPSAHEQVCAVYDKQQAEKQAENA
jgi:hypothetical protein